MTPEEALIKTEMLLGQGLTGIQELVFRQAWEGKSYECMADLAGYDCGYLKDVGSKLWRSLSEAIGQKATKSNFRGLIERHQYRQEIKSDSKPEIETFPNKYRNVPANGAPFYDRSVELTTLSQWILQDRCRLIAILGLGGIGKTALAATLATQLCDRFEFVIWRSLRNAPVPAELLRCLLEEVACDTSNGDFPTAIDTQIERLLLHLRQHRCLIVLDSFESILQGNRMRGRYLTDHEEYGQLLRRLANNRHQSCLLLTSRERPTGLSLLADPCGATHILRLKGLSLEACQHLLGDRMLQRSAQETERIVERYDGNPLALKIATANIHAFFAGNISSFLQQDTAIFGDLWDLLDRQFERLCLLERHLMYWLALREGNTTLAELRAGLSSTIPLHALLGVLDSLRGRSLIETKPAGIGQPKIVMEYVTIRLIDRCSCEILDRSPEVLAWQLFPSIQTGDRPHQARAVSLLQLIAVQLLAALGGVTSTENHLNDLLEQTRNAPSLATGYAAANILELLAHLKGVPGDRSSTHLQSSTASTQATEQISQVQVEAA